MLAVGDPAPILHFILKILNEIIKVEFYLKCAKLYNYYINKKIIFLVIINLIFIKPNY